MPKKDKKKSLKSYTRNPALMIGLVILLPLLGYFGYQKYLDWQNKQLIKGMAEDFPVLIASVEEAIDYPLEISSECLQTQEKFSEGVSLCGLLGYTEGEDSEDRLRAYSKLISENLTFEKKESYRDGAGYTHAYKNITCNFNYEENVRLDCAFGIREANKPLAAELFNEELLNQKKNEALNR